MYKKKIKIRYYITHYPPIYTGAGKSLEKLVKAFDRNKYDIEILTSHRKDLPKIEKEDNITIIRVGGKIFSKNGLLNAYGKLLFSIMSFFYNLFHKDYDVIHFIGIGKVAFPSLLVSRLYKKKIANKYTRVQDDDPCTLKKSLIGKFILFLLKDALHWVISKELYSLAEKCTNWQKSNLILLPNPVNLLYKRWEEIINARKKEQKNKEDIIFIFVGLIGKNKGVDILLNIWTKNNINAKLYLFGPLDEQDKKFKAYFNETLSKNKNIIWKGSVPFEELKKFYLLADVFLFPSRREGLPNVVLEAMSFGLPVIANKIEGVTDYLLGDNERGVIIEENDIYKWENVITNFICKENFRKELNKKAQRAFEWIKSNADAQKVAKILGELYQK